MIVKMRVKTDDKIHVKVTEVPKIHVKVKEGGIGGILPFYEGEYEVTPNTEEQILETKMKSMNNDLTVKPIPFSEVSNPEGGYTVTIG